MHAFWTKYGDMKTDKHRSRLRWALCTSVAMEGENADPSELQALLTPFLNHHHGAWPFVT